MMLTPTARVIQKIRPKRNERWRKKMLRCINGETTSTPRKSAPARASITTRALFFGIMRLYRREGGVSMRMGPLERPTVKNDLLLSLALARCQGVFELTADSSVQEERRGLVTCAMGRDIHSAVDAFTRAANAAESRKSRGSE